MDIRIIKTILTALFSTILLFQVIITAIDIDLDAFSVFIVVDVISILVPLSIVVIIIYDESIAPLEFRSIVIWFTTHIVIIVSSTIITFNEKTNIIVKVIIYIMELVLLALSIRFYHHLKKTIIENEILIY